MSFNVLNAWKDLSVGDRDNMASESILKAMPDVLGLQEFDSNYRSAFGTKSLAEMISESYSEVGASEKSWNPIFYNKNTVTPVAHGFGTYTNGTEHNIYDFGILTVTSKFRTYTWAVLKHIESGKQFLVFNTHLDTDSSKQPSQCAELTAKMTEVMQQYGVSNVFLLGDLNSTATSNTATTLFDFGFTDTRAIAAVKDDLGSCAPGGEHGVGVSITAGYKYAIDHVYCIGEKITVSEYKTIVDIRDSSDHCPICVTLKIK